MAELVYEQPSYRTYPSVVAARIINIVVGIIEFMLGLRIVLELLGASSAAPFVAWVYSVTSSLIGPFANAFPNLSLGGTSLDISAIFAMIGYAIVSWLLVRLLSLVLGTI